jgi:hypothetical protein
MSSQSIHTTAFILSLIGGLVIVVGSVIAVFLSAFGSPYGTYYGMGPGMRLSISSFTLANFSDSFLLVRSIIADWYPLLIPFIFFFYNRTKTFKLGGSKVFIWLNLTDELQSYGL